MKSGHMCFTKVRKSFRILLYFCFRLSWTRYRFNSRLVSGGRFSTCNFFIIFFISSISGSYGTKTIFTCSNCLNQVIKPEAVGPLFILAILLSARFTFSGSDLVPLSTAPRRGAKIFSALKNAMQPVVVCSLCIHIWREFLKGDTTCGCVWHLYHRCVVFPTHLMICEVWRVSATTYGCYSI